LKLFGTDGVRGKAGKFLTSSLALRVAMSAGIYFKNSRKTGKILIGKDTRLSGYMIEDAIVSGLTAVGYNVIQVGPMPTPAVAFLTEDMRCDAGIMISASHNHFSDNGIKFFDNSGNKLSHEAEKEIEEIYYNDSIIESEQQTDDGIGSSKRIEDAMGRYIVHLKNSFPKTCSLNGVRIVLDVANGAAYKVGPTVLEELGAEVFVINNKPNGRNINDNCGALHPQTVADEVKRLRADIGVALDGDADRLVVIDELGGEVNGDQLLGALALYLKKYNHLAKNEVVATVMSNHGLEEFLGKEGIKLHRSAVGDKNVLHLMQSSGSNFGGEQSGHIIMSNFAKSGDGLVSALQVLAYSLLEGKSVSELLRPFKLYPQLLRNVVVGNKIPLGEIDGYGDMVKKIESDGMNHLIRYSGTENLLRILLEGKSMAQLEKSMVTVENFFKKALNG
jgi:phosphoglucosamine mutase